jgi:hypothetical protein
VEPGELKHCIGWEECRFDHALETLLNLRVDMVDNGERTDYFFFHF